MPAALLVLALAGLAVAVDLWLIHVRAHSGGASAFCDISERVSCTNVARSAWAVFLGVPVAAWGALGYVAVAGLALSALSRRRPGPTWPAGLLLVLTGFMSAGAVFLAAISELAIHTFCYMCSVSWGISFALLALSIVLVRRAGGAGVALRADLQALRERPAAALAGAGALAVLGLILLFTRGWSPATVPVSPLPAGNVIPAGAPGSLVVYEYSDYLCPFCASMHTKEKSITARRPDVRMVRRFFPLDATCNPAVKSTVHEGACDLARGGICAEKQGRFEAYDDAAFAGQASRPGPEDLAAQIGLDAAAFRACLSTPETQQRLAADVQGGIQLGVKGTPSFLVQGKLVSAEKFLQLLGLADVAP
jgi:uncharacterized membrane protein/protein-disulfide isomerase